MIRTPQFTRTASTALVFGAVSCIYFIVWAETRSNGFHASLVGLNTDYDESAGESARGFDASAELITGASDTARSRVDDKQRTLEALKSSLISCPGHVTKLRHVTNDWQPVDQTTHVYSAFADPRNVTVSVVRVIAMMLWTDVYSENRRVYYCQIHIQGHTLTVSAHIRTYGSDRKTR